MGRVSITKQSAFTDIAAIQISLNETKHFWMTEGNNFVQKLLKIQNKHSIDSVNSQHTWPVMLVIQAFCCFDFPTKHFCCVSTLFKLKICH